MITGWKDYSILREKDRQEFADCLVQLYHSCDSITEFIAQSGANVASTLYRKDYHRAAPQSYLAFITAAQLGRYIQPLYQFRALAQTLWFYTQEGIEEPFQGYEKSLLQKSKEGNELEQSPSGQPGFFQRLEETRSKGNFENFFTLALQALRDEQHRRKFISWSLDKACGDLFNRGHKFIYLAKSFSLAEDLRWENLETYLFPALHYFVLAPEDRSGQELLRRRLDHHGLKLQERSIETATLSLEQTEQIRDGILYDTTEGMLDTLLGALNFGVEPRAVSEALLDTAAKLVLAIPYDRWIFPVHGFCYTETVHASLDYCNSEQQQRLVLMNGLYLKQVVEAASPFRMQEHFFTPLPPEATPNQQELEEALDLSISSDAMVIFDSLCRRRMLTPQLIGRIALSAVKTDGDKHFGLDLGFTYSAIELYHRSGSANREIYLLALLKFLAEREKTRDLDHAIVKQLRAY